MIGSYTYTQQRPQRILMQTPQLYRCYCTFVTVDNITTLKAACNWYCSIADLIRVVPCSLRGSCQCFEGICCFHIQGKMTWNPATEKSPPCQLHIDIQTHAVFKDGYTIVTLPRIVTPYRDSVDGTRVGVTYQKLVTR